MTDQLTFDRLRHAGVIVVSKYGKENSHPKARHHNIEGEHSRCARHLPEKIGGLWCRLSGVERIRQVLMWAECELGAARCNCSVILTLIPQMQK